jgi:putative Ca2+/H+ antiporter (TMEM165/GDT1 family)
MTLTKPAELGRVRETQQATQNTSLKCVEDKAINEPASPNQADVYAQSQKQTDLTVAQADNSTKETKNWSFWAIFSSTFLTIFFAETGDKTQLATLLMSAESQSPWVVFLGAAIALVATNLISVLVGCWVAKRLSPKTLNLAVALLLLVITGFLIGDVITS